MIVTHWSEHFEDQLRRLFPLDLQFDMGCYVVSIEETEATHGTEFQMANDHWNGYYTGQLDLLLRKFLEREGRWVGRGFATIVRRKDRTEQDMFDTILHEFAHHCENPDDVLKTDPATWPESLELYPYLSVNTICQAVEKNDAMKPARKPWDGHGIPFIFSALNVCHHARHGGVVTLPRLMNIAGSTYGLSEASVYWTAVYGDLRRREHDSIMDIMRDSPPEAIVDLFNSDKDEFERFEAYENGKSRLEVLHRYALWRMFYGRRDGMRNIDGQLPGPIPAFPGTDPTAGQVNAVADNQSKGAA